MDQKIRILESRLNRHLQHFNDAVVDNKNMRDEIDTLRRERIIFDKIYRGLEHNLDQKKKEMANIIEQANSAYEARDIAQTQIALLKTQADKEHVDFEKEWRELGRLIENDKKMKEFVRKKNQEDAQEKARLTKEPKKATFKEEVQEVETVDKALLKDYEEAFSKIQAATGMTQIEDLVKTFMNAEDQNYSLYTYANEQSVFIDSITAEVEQLQIELAELKKNKGQVEPPSQRDRQEELAVKDTEKASMKAQEYQERIDQLCKLLTSIKGGIMSVCNRIGIEVPADMLAIGTYQSIGAMIGLVEDHCGEVLKAYSAVVEAGGDDDGDEILAVQVAAKKEKKGAQVPTKLPTTVSGEDGQDEDEIDEDTVRPLTVSELKEKTQQKLKDQAAKRAARRAEKLH